MSRNPAGVVDHSATIPQGGAGRATLGWRTESRWDSGCEPFLSNGAPFFAGDAYKVQRGGALTLFSVAFPPSITIPF